MMNLVDQVGDVLDAIGVPHGQLRLNAELHNLSYTDGAQVFCKVSRPNFSQRELTLELALANHFGTNLMLRPLHPTTIPMGESVMTVWAWESMVSLWSDKATPTECATAAGLLQHLHGLQVPAALPLQRMTDFGFIRFKIDQRVAFARQHGLTAQDTALLNTLYEALLVPVSFDEPERFVLNHGDPHFGNLVRRGVSQQLCYIDYESAQLAYREFDVAALRVNLDLLGQNNAGWLAARASFDDTVDEAALALFTVARLISMTAYGLLHPDAYDAFRARMGLLNTLYTTGNLPTYFPRLM